MALDAAISKLVDRAEFIRANDGPTSGYGIHLTVAEFGAILRALGREKEAKTMMTLRFTLPDKMDLDPEVLTKFHGEIAPITKAPHLRALTLPMEETEAARDAIAALTGDAAVAEFVASFMDQTKRFDMRLDLDVREGYAPGSAVSTKAPTNDCEHANRPTDSVAGWKCADCDRVVEAEGYDEVKVRMCNRAACSASGQPFLATDGRNCPECSSPFTARVADVGCDECEGESGMERVEVLVCPGCEEVAETDA